MGLSISAGSLGLFGSAFSAFGAISQAKAAAYYNAALLRNNAVLAEQNAKDALLQGQLEKEQLRSRVSKTRAAGAVGYAAGNVALGSGSPLNWFTALGAQETMDLNTIEENARRKEYGYKMEAAGYRGESMLKEYEGRNAVRAGTMGAVNSLLAGASNFMRR